MTDPRNPNAAFTREDALYLTPDQAVEWWKIHNQARRDAGLDHYSRLLNPISGAVVATIDNG